MSLESACFYFSLCFKETTGISRLIYMPAALSSHFPDASLTIRYPALTGCSHPTPFSPTRGEGGIPRVQQQYTLLAPETQPEASGVLLLHPQSTVYSLHTQHVTFTGQLSAPFPTSSSKILSQTWGAEKSPQPSGALKSKSNFMTK